MSSASINARHVCPRPPRCQHHTSPGFPAHALSRRKSGEEMAGEGEATPRDCREKARGRDSEESARHTCDSTGEDSSRRGPELLQQRPAAGGSAVVAASRRRPALFLPQTNRQIFRRLSILRRSLICLACAPESASTSAANKVMPPRPPRVLYNAANRRHARSARYQPASNSTTRKRVHAKRATFAKSAIATSRQSMRQANTITRDNAYV